MSDFGIKKGYYMFRNSSNNIKTVGEITHLTKKFVICNFWKLEIPHTLPSRECFYENFKKDKLYCPIEDDRCSGGCGKSDFNCRCGAGSPWY